MIIMKLVAALNMKMKQNGPQPPSTHILEGGRHLNG